MSSLPGAAAAQAWTEAATADAIAAAVLACPAVAALHGGGLRRTATYLPGRLVEGVHVDEDRLRVAVVAALRAQLRAALRDGPLAIGADADAVEAVLLAFEELASNGLRHGRPPMHVTVTATGWLLEVSDGAADRPPAPAVGRDPVYGGLGLHLVARLCPAHGWIPRNGRKHVWAHVAPAAAVDTTADADAG